MKIKKIPCIFYKILAFTCAFTFNPEMSNIKVSGMEQTPKGEANWEGIEAFLNKTRSPDIRTAILANDKAYLRSKGYINIYPFGFDFMLTLKYECHKKNSKNEYIVGKSIDLYRFVSEISNETCTLCNSMLGNNENCLECIKKQCDALKHREQIYILANTTGLSLNTILCYLATFDKKDLPNKFKELMEDFNNKKLDKIKGYIKEEAKYFFY